MIIKKILDNINNSPNLFFYRDNTNNIKKLVDSSDLNLIFTGIEGCGKFANILYLLQYSPFCPNSIKNNDINLNKFKYYDNKPSKSDEILLNKILYYENIFIIDFDLISNNELYAYFDFIKSITNTCNLDKKKKIIICRHIDALPIIYQKQLGANMEKTNSIFLLATSHLCRVNKKILSSSAIIRIPAISFKDFIKLDYWINISTKKKYIDIINSLYSIYVNNNYHWGYTLAQIKWNLNKWNLKQIHNNIINTFDIIPIQNKIILPLITKYSKLSNIIKLEDIRSHLMALLSLNISPNIIIRTSTQYYLNTKVKYDIKIKIIEFAAHTSRLISKTEKHLPILENFFYKIINLYFST